MVRDIPHQGEGRVTSSGSKLIMVILLSFAVLLNGLNMMLSKFKRSSQQSVHPAPQEEQQYNNVAKNSEVLSVNVLKNSTLVGVTFIFFSFVHKIIERKILGGFQPDYNAMIHSITHCTVSLFTPCYMLYELPKFRKFVADQFCY